MIEKGLPVRQTVHEYLFNLEAMTRKEAKRLWRQAIKNAWGDRCAYCGNPPIDDNSLTVDHVRPKSKGGTDRTRNCVPACSRCNHSKGSEDWREWFVRQYFYTQARAERIEAWLETGIVINQDNTTVYASDLPDSGEVSCHPEEGELVESQ